MRPILRGVAMLVVTSNWGLTDGTLVGGPVAGLARRLRIEVQRAAWRCGMRADGRYRPIDAIDVVLAGDTFDWLTSREWAGAVKPWQTGSQAAAVRDRVVAAAGRRAVRLRAVLASWARRGLAVPAADRRGRPETRAHGRVPVRVTALRGDRDAWIDRLSADLPSLLPGAAVGISWSDGRLAVLHGDPLDPLQEAAGAEPSLGESLAVDLITAFGVALDGLPAARPAAEAIMRAIVAGAVLDAPRRLVDWVAAERGGGRLSSDTRLRLFAEWNRTVCRWHGKARRLSPRGPGGIDIVGELAAGLEIDGAAGRLPEATVVYPRMVSGAGDPQGERAAAENPSVILGHAFPGGVGPFPQGAVCLAAGAESPLPPLAAVASAAGHRVHGPLEWLGEHDGAGRWSHARHDTAAGGWCLRGVWLSDDPQRGRPFVDAA